MKNIFANFYIFSKLALSFSLLACLLGALYLLYINYRNENIISQNELRFEKELQNSINNNSELIKKISSELKANEKVLDQIKENIKIFSNKDQGYDISLLNKNIQSLNDDFNLLSIEIQNLKNNNLSLLSDDKKNDANVVNNSKNDIIDLIFIKYQNNISFNQEFEYLRKIINNKNISNIEKISILSNEPFKGHEYVKNIFDEEVKIYLKKIINKNPDSLFSKIILPYLEVSPSSENIVKNDLILKIKEIKLNIENRNMEDAFKNLKTIEDYENIFYLSSLEINKYINFKNELYRLK